MGERDYWLAFTACFCSSPNTGKYRRALKGFFHPRVLSTWWLVVAIAGASRESNRCDYRLSQGSY
ncbi:MAG: hypothetical protein KME50_32470 [Nostoc desertorum CM1-VF14]|nr:hypothetical protein [Nostoc desertorum CM1-VF14]